MKKLLIILLAISVMSCEIIVEPRIDLRDQLIGQYTMDEYSETFDDSWAYDVVISKRGYGNDIYISNFYNADITVLAYLNGTNINIPLQTVDGYEIQGNGSWRDDRLVFSYRVRDTYARHAPNDFCTADAWRVY